MRPDARRQRHLRRSANGFTLLELLVAMTLLGLLMTALFGGLRLGARVWEASDRFLNDESRALTIRRFLHDRLEQAFPAGLQQLTNEAFAFAGERTTLRFASTMPESLGFGPFALELALQPGSIDEAAHDLVLRWQAFDPVGDSPDERVLISGLSTITFAYFGAKGATKSTPAWHATWRDQTALPNLIRLDIGVKEDRSTNWPPLIVAPRVNARHGPGS